MEIEFNFSKKSHKQRIKENFYKFKNEIWTIDTYSKEYGVGAEWIRFVLNQIMFEKNKNENFEKYAFGLPLPNYNLIEIPDSVELIPDRIIEHENHVELIYKSKIQ